MRSPQSERIYQTRKGKDLTQDEAAKLIGVSKHSWYKAEKGKSNFSVARMKLISEKFGVNLNWLLTGDGNKSGETETLKNIQTKKIVKLIGGEVLAGLTNGGGEEIQATESNTIYIPGLKSTKDCYAINVSGRSMEPQIKEGSMVVLERIEEKAEFVDSKPYVVIVEGVPFLKYVSMILSGEDKGKFELSSSNESRTQIVDSDQIIQWYKVIYVLNPV